MQRGNLFSDSAAPAAGERFETLLEHRNLVVERIVSGSDVSPVEYVQPQDEWVVLLRGAATLVVDGETVALVPGDHVFLPARVPHTVVHTAPGALWLAVHLHPGDGAPDAATDR
jgi:cupin 2 domain-containing protein